MSGTHSLHCARAALLSRSRIAPAPRATLLDHRPCIAKPIGKRLKCETTLNPAIHPHLRPQQMSDRLCNQGEWMEYHFTDATRYKCGRYADLANPCIHHDSPNGVPVRTHGDWLNATVLLSVNAIDPIFGACHGPSVYRFRRCGIDGRPSGRDESACDCYIVSRWAGCTPMQPVHHLIADT